MTDTASRSWLFSDVGPATLHSPAGATIALRGNARHLIAILVAHEGARVNIELLVDEIWGDVPPPSVHASLRNTVSRLRQQCSQLDSTAEDPIGSSEGAYAAGGLISLSSALREATDVERLDLLDRFPSALSGEPHDGTYCSTVDVDRERVRLLQREVGLQVVDERLRSGDRERCEDLLVRLTAAHPFDEDLWRHRIVIAEAHRGPSAAAEVTSAAILALSEVVSDPSPRLFAGLEATRGRIAQSTEPVSAPPTGRHAIADLLTDALTKPDGRGSVFKIEAPAGYGKTFLLDWFVEHASERTTAPIRLSIGRADAGSVARWWKLAGLSTPSRASALASESAPIEDQIPEVVAALVRQTRFVVVDDAHRADATSLAILTGMAEVITREGGMLVVATRPGGPRIADAIHLTLLSWTEADVETFLAERGHDTHRSAELHQLGGGVPLLISELAKSASSTAGYPALLRRQLGSIGDDAQRTVQSLALAGHAIEIPRLARLLQTTPAEQTRLVDIGIACGLLRRDGLSVSVLHELVADAVISEMDQDLHLHVRKQLGLTYGSEARASDDPQLADLAIEHLTELFERSPDSYAGTILINAIEHSLDLRWRNGDYQRMVADVDLADRVAQAGVEIERHRAVAIRLASAACRGALGDHSTGRQELERAAQAAAGASTEAVADVARATVRRSWTSAPAAARDEDSITASFRPAARAALARNDATPADRAALHLGLAFDADLRGNWSEIPIHTQHARVAQQDAPDRDIEALTGILELRTSADRPELAKERLALARRSLTLALAGDDHELVGRSRWLVAIAECCLGDFKTLEEMGHLPARTNRDRAVRETCRSIVATVTGQRDVPVAPVVALTGMPYLAGVERTPDPTLFPPATASAARVAKVALSALSGDVDQAKPRVLAITSVIERYRDHTWAVTLALMSAAAWVCGDDVSARRLLPHLIEVRSVAACPTTGASPYFGSMELHIATAAATVGDYDLAYESLDRADRFHDKGGLVPFKHRAELQRADLRTRTQNSPQSLVDEHHRVQQARLDGLAQLCSILLARFS